MNQRRGNNMNGLLTTWVLSVILFDLFASVCSMPVAYNEIQIIEFLLKKEAGYSIKEKPSLMYYFDDRAELKKRVFDPTSQCETRNREELLKDDGRNSIFRFVMTPKNGIAGFANRRIRRGELILLERPLLILSEYLDRVNPYESFFVKMTDLEEEIFFSFADSSRTSRYAPKTFNGIMNTNSFSVTCGSGIFSLITRINHSCQPNTHYSWDVLNHGLALYAQKDIEEGEELSVSYIHVTADTKTRKHNLLHNFKFDCQCELCARQDAHQVELSDWRRNRINMLKEQARRSDCQKPMLAIQKYEEVLELYRQEDMLYNANYIGEITENIVRTLLRLDHKERNTKLVSKYASYTIGNYTICYGEERTLRDFHWAKTLI